MPDSHICSFNTVWESHGHRSCVNIVGYLSLWCVKRGNIFSRHHLAGVMAESDIECTALGEAHTTAMSI